MESREEEKKASKASKQARLSAVRDGSRSELRPGSGARTEESGLASSPSREGSLKYKMRESLAFCDTRIVALPPGALILAARGVCPSVGVSILIKRDFTAAKSGGSMNSRRFLAPGISPTVAVNSISQAHHTVATPILCLSARVFTHIATLHSDCSARISRSEHCRMVSTSGIQMQRFISHDKEIHFQRTDAIWLNDPLPQHLDALIDIHNRQPHCLSAHSCTIGASMGVLLHTRVSLPMRCGSGTLACSCSP